MANGSNVLPLQRSRMLYPLPGRSGDAIMAAVNAGASLKKLLLHSLCGVTS